MTKLFWPETLSEWDARMDLPTDEQRMDYYSIIKDVSYPPGDIRRYLAKDSHLEADRE